MSVQEEKPECFGLMWEPFGDSECVGCGLKHECLDLLAKSKYPETLEKLKATGKEDTVQNLSAELGLNPEATLAVRQYAMRLPIIGDQPPPVQIPEHRPEPVPEPAPTPSPIEQSLEKSVDGPAPISEPPAPQESPVSQESGAAAVVEAQPEEAVVVKLPTAKGKKPKAEKKPKAKAKGKKVELAVVPQKAGPAPSAGEPAKTKKGGKKSAKRAKGRGATSPKKPAPKQKATTAPGEKRVWGKHTFHTRWTRERERNPLIAALTPGSKLKREYKGAVMEVKTQAGYYTFNGMEYPTLQAATTAATGAREYPKQAVEGKRQKGTRLMGNWSAAKFWKLKELVASRKG